MTANKGKLFEQDFKQSLDALNHIWTFRPSDFGGGKNSRFTNQSLCDLFVFNNKTGNLFLFELKSTQSTSISCPPVKEVLNLLEQEMKLDDILIKGDKKVAQKALKQALKHLNSYKIKYHQIKSLLEIETNPWYLRIYPYFLLNFRNTNTTYLIKPSDLYQALIDTHKSSVNINDILSHNGIEIQQEQIRKTQHYKYIISDILEV